jgi:hypothetical protein
MNDMRSTPIEGQSHWCDGKTTDEEPCYQIVRDDSDHCETGHKNRIRVSQTPASEVRESIVEARTPSSTFWASPEVEVMTAVRTSAKPARDDYAAGRAVWEAWWRNHHLPVRVVLQAGRDRRMLRKAGLAALESKYPQDYVAVRVDSNAKIRSEFNARRSPYHDRVGLAYRDPEGDRPILGYSVLVRFAPLPDSIPGTNGAGVSFFWRELLPIPRTLFSR